MTFQEKYKPYNDWLIENVGLDWFDVQDKYQLLGNCPGIYPDTAMLLCQVAMRDEVKTIVELGSGASTLYLETITKQLGKQLISFEELEQYTQLTKDLCAFYNLNPEIRLLDDKWDIPQADFIWVDCGKERRNKFWDRLDTFKWIEKVKWYIQDDSQNPVYAIPMIEGLHYIYKSNLSFYNPVGRADREQLICNSDSDFSTTAWVWSWRPDKVFW